MDPNSDENDSYSSDNSDSEELPPLEQSDDEDFEPDPDDDRFLEDFMHDLEDLLEEDPEIPEDKIHSANEIPNSRIYEKDGYKWQTGVPPGPTPNFRPNRLIGAGHGSVRNFGKMETPGQFWELFFSDQILNLICSFTNKFGSKKYGEKWKNLDIIEIRGLIGFLYLCGLGHRRHLGIEAFFSSDAGIGSIYAPSVFSRERMKLILAALRFDDKENRDEADPLAQIREFFDEFTENCRTVYVPGSFITIDESVADFRGHCKFRMYLPSKPCRYGIKIWCANDSENFYLHNAKVYAGKENEAETNTAEKTVLSLTENLRKSGRTFTMDNFFTSIPLAERLLLDRTYCVGTMRPNRFGVPLDFVDQKYDKNQTGFIFHKLLSLTKFQSKADKAVYLLSTKHLHTIVSDSGNGKPQVVLDYNSTIGAVDSFDQMIDRYSTKQKSKRWSMRIFYWTLDAAALNAFRLFSKKNEKLPKNRPKFLSQLAVELMKPLQERRASSSHWYAVATRRFLDAARILRDKVLGVRPDPNEYPETAPQPAKASKRVRCAICPRGKDRKTSLHCKTCKLAVCSAHSISASNTTTFCTKCKK